MQSSTKNWKQECRICDTTLKDKLIENALELSSTNTKKPKKKKARLEEAKWKSYFSGLQETFEHRRYQAVEQSPLGRYKNSFTCDFYSQLKNIFPTGCCCIHKELDLLLSLAALGNSTTPFAAVHC